MTAFHFWCMQTLEDVACICVQSPDLICDQDTLILHVKIESFNMS